MPTSDPIHWKPPRSPYCKLKCYIPGPPNGGHWRGEKKLSGQVIRALSDRIHLLSAIDDVEAFACRRATSFALDIGVEEVVFEGDSETIINALNSDSSCLSFFGHVVEDIRAFVLNFVLCVFSHVKRWECSCR